MTPEEIQAEIDSAEQTTMPVAELLPREANPRKNSHAAKALAKTVEEVGWGSAPLIQKSSGMVIAGHTRLKAAKQLGLERLPVRIVDVDDRRAKALALADNRIGELADWDVEGLAQDLSDFGLDEVEKLGFDSKYLEDLADKVEGFGPLDVTEDEVPEPPKDPVTKPGDVWLLGDHRLVCGDCTDAATVKGAALNGRMADLCLTDPPYGADIQYASHNDTQSALVGLVAGFFPLAQEVAPVVALTPGINNVWLYPQPDWLLCWFYGAGTGRSPWGFTAWQPFMVWGKCPKLAAGEGCHPDGFQFMMSRDDAEENRSIDHACPKPLSVWRRFMERLTNKNTRTVYDPFLGSGTTLIAAEQLGRVCVGTEIDPAYCDVIVERWTNLTGQSANRA